MKKLLTRILVLICFVLALNAIFYRFFIQPHAGYSWGYEDLHAKRMYLMENDETINTLFLGSSAMFRHIDPAEFDKSCQDSLSIKSFNFGIPAMFPMQSEYTYRHLLEEDSPELNYVFMDLMEVGNFFLILNAQRKRTHYWYNFKSYKEALRIVSKYESPAFIKGTAYVSYTIAYLARLFNAEVVEEVLLTKKEKEFIDFPSLIDNRNGFYPLDWEYEDTKDESDAMKNRMQMFKKDTLQNLKLILASESFNANEANRSYSVNQLHLDKINQLIALSEVHGIHLIFILHPRLQRYEYPMVLPLYEQIDVKHKINLSDSRKYPQFYQAANTFDPLHLNEKGAAVFSRALAEEFQEILKED